MRPAFFYLLAVIIVVTDQVTKWVIQEKLPFGTSMPAIGRYLYLTHTHNTGGAFSLFQAGNSMFMVVASLAILALVYAYHRMRRTDLAVAAALSLALGGAIGNLIDRVRFGHVIDFFDIQNGHGKSIWPIFNVADSAITVGIVLLAAHFLFAKHSPEPQTATPPETRQEDPPAPPEGIAVMNANERE